VLLAVAVLVAVEAIGRLSEPPEIATTPVLIFGAIARSAP
jgi:Co/Zn/Cd efflux system component